LWYIVRSFSQAGTFTVASAAVGKIGEYGKLSRFRAGNVGRPA
jgi:hypothetical protein